VTGLVLPQIALEVPRRLVISQDQKEFAKLAQAMMRLGVLRSEHWAGSLDTTCEKRLDDWIVNLCGMGQVRFLDSLEIHYTKDITRGYYPDPYWEHCKEIGLEPPEDGESIGGVLICSYGSDDEFCAEPGVTNLNTMYQDLGWNIYHVLRRALQHTIGIADYCWALDRLNEWGDFFEREEDDFPLNSETWAEAHPPQLGGRWKVDTKLLTRIEEQTRSDDDESIWALVSHARALIELVPTITKRPYRRTWKSYLRDYTHEMADNNNGMPFVPFSLTWDAESQLSRIVDDHNNGLRQCGEGHIVHWAYFFKDGHARYTAERALVKLRWVLTVLRLCDQMMQIIDAIGQLQPEMAIRLYTPSQRVRVRG
jgi:hypothetical protein